VKAARATQKPVRSAVGLRVRGGKPVVTFSLIGLNVAIFLAGTVLGEEGWVYRLGLNPSTVGSEPWKLLTSGFAHFDVAHIGLNMFALLQFGLVVEALLGHLRFAILYVVSLLGGSLMIAMIGKPHTLHAGASGAIFGVLAAFVVLSLLLKRPAYDVMTMGGLWLVLGFVVPGLSWEGHLGGTITGAVTAFALVWLGEIARRRSKRLHR
jgi:membrane associated rhomboid family serine protease